MKVFKEVGEEIKLLLQAPFHPTEIEWRAGAVNKEKKQALALAYVTNRAIQNRLDEVFGVFGWKNEFLPWKDGGQLCGISVKNGDEWITKYDGADNSNMEATKGGLSDSMKRAAYQWGIGRYLYKLPTVWVKASPRGNSWVLDEVPNLPAWALPSDPTNEPETPMAVEDVVKAPPPGEKMTQEEVMNELGGQKATFEKAKEMFDKPEAKKEDSVESKRSAIRAMILELAGEDENKAKDMLENLTTFQGKDGEVKGKRSVADLTVKQVPVVYRKVQDMCNEQMQENHMGEQEAIQ